MSTAVKKEHKSARPERGGQATMVEAIRQGISLEERFLEKAGGDAEATRKLSWLEGSTT